MRGEPLQRQQIIKIHNYLQSRYVHYIDVQLEVVDHIASKIESRIVEDGLTFEESYKLEIKYWSYAELDNVVENKRKYLNRYWINKMYGYLIEFFSWPKIVLVIASYFALIGFAHFIVTPSSFISYSLILLFAVLITAIIATQFHVFMKENYQESLLTIESYNRGLANTYSLTWLGYVALQLFPLQSYSSSIGVLISAGLIIVSIALFYATWIVFPKWLRKDVLDKYDYLVISN